MKLYIVWFYVHFKYLIVYRVIILYFSVLLPIVSILLCIDAMNETVESRRVGGGLN